MGAGLELDKTNGEPLSPRELNKRVGQLVTAYAERSMPALYDAVRKGEGKQTLGLVPGRNEDQLAIDGYGQDVIVSLLTERQMSAFILGEHSPRNVMEFGKPQIIIAQDPFDNSKQYKEGFDTSVYSVLSVYALNGKPLAGVICDIKDRKSYVSVGNTIYLYDNEDPAQYRELKASSQTTIKDKGTTVATYLGEDPYRGLFLNNFGELINDMEGLLYTGGGAYIYGLLANGSVDAYVMFNEPLSEILPGLPLAIYAGCTIVSVNRDGEYWDFRFDPDLAQNPERYRKESVPLFIAASTPELTEEIIRYYLRATGVDASPRKIKRNNPSTAVSEA